MTRRPGPTYQCTVNPPSNLVLPVLGVPVRFETGEPGLAHAVDAAFGAWRGLESYPELVSDPARTPVIRLSLSPGVEQRSRAGPLAVRTRAGGWLRLRGAGLAGVARVDRMSGRLRVAPDASHDGRSVREALDTLTLFLVTRLDREPVHGAAIADGDQGLVLAGPSGVGKSTLALAALRAGLRVLTDDAVYVQLRPRLRVWGMARPLHVPAGTAERFPDLAAGPAVVRPGGKRKVAVALESGGETFGEPPVLERTGLCVLEPGGQGPSVAPLPVEEAVRMLVSRLDPGFDAFRDTIPERVRALAAGGAWRVRVGAEPERALPALRELLESTHR